MGRYQISSGKRLWEHEPATTVTAKPYEWISSLAFSGSADDYHWDGLRPSRCLGHRDGRRLPPTVEQNPDSNQSGLPRSESACRNCTGDTAALLQPKRSLPLGLDALSLLFAAQWMTCSLLAIAFWMVTPSMARAADQNLLDLSLQELGDVKVSVASNKERSVREQAGVVSVITENEIRSSGARNLIDLLQQVPGFSFGQDVQGGLGPIFRGIWAYEGKTLLVVDGIEMNEMLFGTLQLEFRLPAELIRQVEIIRGPGSAMYGGSAELSVIRVTTKGAEANGGFASSSIQYSSGKIGHDHALAYGQTRGNWRWSFNGSFAEDFLATRTYTDLTGVSYSLKRDSDAQPRSANFGLGYRDLDVRVLYESIPLENRLDLGPVIPSIERVTFDTLALQAQYRIKVAPWLTLTPRLGYKVFRPWQIRTDAGNDVVDVRQPEAGLQAHIDLSDRSKLPRCADVRRQTAQAKDETLKGLDAGSYYAGRSSISYDTFSVFAQMEQETSIANFTIGGRYEHHSEVGGAFVPRLAITRAWERWHVKALYSEAFRTPNIQLINLALNGALEPERTRSYEIETGYKFNEHLRWVGNLFFVRLKKPLIYTVLPGGQEGYFNDDRVSTYGFETELKYTATDWDASLGYSRYAAYESDVAAFQTPTHHSLMGAPNHKLTASVVWRFLPSWFWNLNGSFSSDRYAYQYSSGGLGRLPPEWMINTYVEYRYKKLHVGVGGSNLLNQQRWFAQPYAGDAGPLPARSREWFARCRIEF